MSERLPSGHPRLDGVLGGGLPANAINVLIGLPGAGKTILAQQYVFANATPERPALYLSTVSEPLEKILRYGQSLGFFAPEAVGTRGLLRGSRPVLNERGLDAVSERIGELIRERRPGIIVIDSFKALSAYADATDFRRFLHELAGRLSAFPATASGSASTPRTRSPTHPSSPSPTRSSRSPQRGAATARAAPSVSSSSAAARLVRRARLSHHLGRDRRLPAARRPVEIDDYALGGVRISSGIAALDEMLADGYWPGASTLCAGPSGCGKTLMGLHFIFNGARDGEPGVIATLQENPMQLERIVRGFGWSLQEPPSSSCTARRSTCTSTSGSTTCSIRWSAIGARRVLIDSLTDLQLAAPDAIRFREYMYSLVQRLSRQGVSLFMTSELPDLFHVGRLSEFGVSHLSDNVVLLQYIRDSAVVRRALTVLKTRASQHEPEIREFTITPEGIVLGGTFAPAQSFG